MEKVIEMVLVGILCLAVPLCWECWCPTLSISSRKELLGIHRVMGRGSLMMLFIGALVSVDALALPLSMMHPRCLEITITEVVGTLCAIFFFLRWVIPKLLLHQSCLTLEDLLAKTYGKRAGYAAIGCMGIASLLMVIGQLCLVGRWALVFGLPSAYYPFFIVVAACFLGGYTWLTIFRPIAFLSVVRFVALFILLSTLSLCVFQHLSRDITGPEAGMALLKHVGEGVSNHSAVLGRFLLYGLGTMFFFPAIMIYMMAIQPNQRVKHALLGSTLMGGAIKLLLCWGGFILASVVVKGEVYKGVDEYIVSLFLVEESCEKHLYWCLCLILPLGMAYLHLRALALMVWMVQGHFAQKKKKKRSKHFSHRLKNIRWMGLLGSLLAGCCAIGIPPTLVIDWKTCSLIVLLPLVLPSLLSIWGIKNASRPFWTSLITYALGIFSVFFMGKLCGSSFAQEGKMTDLICSWLPWIWGVSGLLFVVVYLIERKRIQWQKWETPPQNWRMKQGEKWYDVLLHPMEYAKEAAKKYGIFPTRTGFLFLLLSIFPFVGWGDVPSTYFSLARYMFVIGILFSALVFLYPLWPIPWRIHYLPLTWFVLLWYQLPFSHALLFFVAPNSLFVVLRFSAALFLLSVLVGWGCFCLFTLSGVTFALMAHLILAYLGEKVLFDHAYDFYTYLPSFCFILLFFFVVGWLFLSKKEQQNTEAIKRTKLLASAFGHDLRNALISLPLEEMKSLVKENEDKPVPYAEWRVLFDAAEEGMKQVHRDAVMFEDLIRYDSLPTNPLIKCHLGDIVQEIKEKLPLTYRNKVDYDQHGDDFEVKVCIELFEHVITNLVKNAFWHGNASRVILYADEQKRSLYIQDNGSGIPLTVQPYIFDMFYSTNGRGIGLPFSRMIIESFGGTLSLYETSAQGTTFVIDFL